MTAAPAERSRLVVLGCGFGGFSMITRLPPTEFDVTLVSPRNHFLFYPLLASATVGTVEFRSIVEPVRRRAPSLRLLEATAEAVDWEARRVACRSAVGEDRFEIPFDVLVVAVGAAVADYGVPGVFAHALTLRSLEDARAIRKGILEQFARAEVPGLAVEEQARRLTFVVCGGGATGVEVAAEIHDLIRGEVKRYMPELAARARVVLIEAAGRILTGFDEALSGYAQEHFRREGIEVRTGAGVASVEPGLVRLRGGAELACGLVVWAGGNAAVPLIERLGQPTDERGRLQVDAFLRLPGRRDAYGLGDCATPEDAPLPATAQVAQSQGKYLARALRRRRRGKPVAPFRFHSSGMLAYIGADQALADTPHVKWSGRGAWLFWRSVYLTKLVGFPNKVKVLFDWIKARLFGRDLSRF
jgi:NADH:quinone reductase (non-electrogenic)